MARERNRVGRAFADALRAARLKARLTQEALAEAADFKPAYISLLESGVRQPTVTAIIAFEQALSLEPGELVKETTRGLRGKRLGRSGVKPKTRRVP